MKILTSSILLMLFISVFISCDKKEDNQPPCEMNTPIVFLGNNINLDEGESILLDADNQGSSYLWSTGETTQTIFVNTEGFYWVNVSNCAGSDSDTIFIYDTLVGEDPPIVELGDDIILSEGDFFEIDAGNEGATYLWSTGETTQIISVDTTGIYWVSVTNSGGTNLDTINIDLAYKTIHMETDYGNFRIWLYSNTPLHKANFIDLTEDSFYNNLIFHRVVLNFVIQGGDPEGTGFGGPGYTIPAEIISGLNHDYGALGAARMPDNVNPERESNGSQFYIVTNPNGRHDLNGDYTVFGYVFNGIENVYEISEVPVDANFKPIDDVTMNAVTIDYLTAQDLEEDFGFVIP